MAIMLKSRVSKNEIRLVSVKDTAIDWAAICEGSTMTIQEAKDEYTSKREASFLKFKADTVPTVFCFTDPRSATFYDEMQNLMIRMSNMNDSKAHIESNRIIWDHLYIGCFDGIWEGNPQPMSRDKKNKLNDAFVQSLIDAGVYGELSLAIINVFATTMGGGSVSEDSKS